MEFYHNINHKWRQLNIFKIKRNHPTLNCAFINFMEEGHNAHNKIILYPIRQQMN